MDMQQQHTLMKINMLDTGKMDGMKEKELLFGQMETNIVEIGLMVGDKVLANMNTKAEQFMRVNSKKVKKVVREH